MEDASIEFVEGLLVAGVDPNRFSDGFLVGLENPATALMVAARQGKTAICILLVKHGADPDLWFDNETDEAWMCPLALAAMFGRIDTLRMLIGADIGADYDATDPRDGSTAFHAACDLGHVKRPAIHGTRLSGTRFKRLMQTVGL